MVMVLKHLHSVTFVSNSQVVTQEKILQWLTPHRDCWIKSRQNVKVFIVA